MLPLPRIQHCRCQSRIHLLPHHAHGQPSHPASFVFCLVTDHLVSHRLARLARAVQQAAPGPSLSPCCVAPGCFVPAACAALAPRCPAVWLGHSCVCCCSRQRAQPCAAVVALLRLIPPGALTPWSACTAAAEVKDGAGSATRASRQMTKGFGPCSGSAARAQGLAVSKAGMRPSARPSVLHAPPQAASANTAEDAAGFLRWPPALLSCSAAASHKAVTTCTSHTQRWALGAASSCQSLLCLQRLPIPEQAGGWQPLPLAASCFLPVVGLLGPT